MKFLLPIGGIVDHRFGILATPASYGVPAGIVAGMAWAADNQCFSKEFDESFFRWLTKMEPHRETCLFVTCPDCVGDAVETLRLFGEWRGKFPTGWPVAFVAQDGQEELEFPPADQWDSLFVGGSTAWKLSEGAQACIVRAQKLGKHIHIGRVNWRKRYNHFASMEGSNEWTCDGTRTKYERDRAIIAWAQYMAWPTQKRLPIPVME